MAFSLQFVGLLETDYASHVHENFMLHFYTCLLNILCYKLHRLFSINWLLVSQHYYNLPLVGKLGLIVASSLSIKLNPEILILFYLDPSACFFLIQLL